MWSACARRVRQEADVHAGAQDQTREDGAQRRRRESERVPKPLLLSINVSFLSPREPTIRF